MKHPGSTILIHKSQIFIAFCAAAMGAETYLVSGTAVSLHILSILFFATLFIYNASRLNLSLFNIPTRSRHTLQLEGSSFSIAICLSALLILFGLLTGSNWFQLLIFMGTSMLSLIYMMPFTRNGVRIRGLRNNLILKNILLSVTWACATVLFPISMYNQYWTEPELVFLFLRRFFFIYALTVIYDLRDLDVDKKAGMQTIALRFGETATKLWSLTSLAVFVLLIFIDPTLSDPGAGMLSAALIVSAIIAALIVLNTHLIRNTSYYSFVVDGAMALQFILVLLFRQV